jgi:hypothetical protein
MLAMALVRVLAPIHRQDTLQHAMPRRGHPAVPPIQLGVPVVVLFLAEFIHGDNTEQYTAGRVMVVVLVRCMVLALIVKISVVRNNNCQLNYPTLNSGVFLL